MKVKATDILYQTWEEIPLNKLRVILQVLPFVQWSVNDDPANTYVKNFILRHCFKSLKTYKLTTAEQRVDLFTHELRFLRAPSCYFPLRSYRMEGKVFRAPTKGMSDITIERLAQADTSLSRYIITERSNYIGEFIAALYHELGTEYGNQEEFEANAKILYKIPDHEKAAIIRAYLGSRKLLMKQCPYIFPEPKTRRENKSDEIKKPKAQDTGPMWQTLIFELANTSAYPGMELAKKANAWEALQYFDREMEKTSQINKKLQKA
jgi:hypothetical protein